MIKFTSDADSCIADRNIKIDVRGDTYLEYETIFTSHL